MALFDTTPSRGGSRFGKLSSNMFFTRNTAKPKRVRHIEGLNGALICSVNDDQSAARSTSVTSLGFTRPNMPMFEIPRRVERLIPPMGFWNTYGVVPDTDRWRKELASLAAASGLGSEHDEHKRLNRPPTTTDEQNASRSGARYSTRTGRFNESSRKSRGRTGSKHGTPLSDMLFTVPEHEREMWMLQVLCQLLGTSNLEDVQSWLVSASPTEKEQARNMITAALRGLKESERTPNQTEQSVDLNDLSNFVEKQKNEEKQLSQKYVKEIFNNRPVSTLQSIHEEQHGENNLEQNTTTNQRPYINFNRRSYSSFETGSLNNKDNFFDENAENQKEDESIEQNEQAQRNESLQRARSQSVANTRAQSKQLTRSSSSFNQKHRIESLQLADEDENTNNIQNPNEHQYEDDDEPPQVRKDFILPPIKPKESLNQDENSQSRKIRELRSKLSRQEEEAKRHINELQSKQSRLENAIKLLTKQATAQGKRQQQNQDDFNVPDANGLLESEQENDRRYYGKQQDTSIPEYRPTRSYSGIWKPDAATLHRLQGN